MPTPLEFGALGFGFTCLLTLVTFVWHAASTTTEHRLRLEGLERRLTGTEVANDRLWRALDEMTKALYRLRGNLQRTDALVNPRTGSQHDFDDSDKPPR